MLNVALVFLAGALALRAPRMQRGWWLVMGTVCVGFIVFFLGDFLEILGISERLPIMIAAFAPAMISLLMGLTALLYLEDG
jgi:lipopolysaccharide export system permease protein